MTKKPVAVAVVAVLGAQAVWPLHQDADHAPQDLISFFPPTQHMPDEEPRGPPGNQSRFSVAVITSTGSTTNTPDLIKALAIKLSTTQRSS